MKKDLLSKTLSFLLVIVMLVSAIPVMSTAEELNPQPAVTGTEVIDPKESQDELLADCSILKYVDEKEFESHGFLQRCPAEEELNTYVFQLEGGQRAVYFLDENVKFVDESGLILEKDLTLVEGEGGYKTACNDIDVTLPLALEDGVSFKYNDVSITVRPVTDKEASAESDERYVEYKDAFGDGTSLVYTPTLSGLKEDIVIDSKDAPETYSFTMYTNGLSLFSDEEGLYLAADEDAEEKIRLGSVQLYDSGDRMGRGEIFTETVSEGEEYIITLVPDQEFLQDERTEYPVTIDPTLTVSDNTYGSGAIWDAPIFQGQPDENFGDYRYDRLGTPSEAGYGVGRTVVKLPGLTDSSVYQTITAGQISSVYFYAKESYGASYQTINVHPITVALNWTESDVKWNTIESYSSSIDCSNTMNNGAWTQFNITDIVLAWRSGTLNCSASKGFIMKNSNESNDECFDSCESYTSAYRPYVLMVYSSSISIGAAEYDVDEGSTVNLSATTNPSGATITWTSNDTSVATVSSSGVVTGITARTKPVTITATATIGGVTQSACCYVYVTIADGIYKLKNQNTTNKYLHVELGGTADGTDVILFSGYAYNMGNRYQIRQMWRIHYLGQARYSIRPLNKLGMGLMNSSDNVTVSQIGTIDTISGVPYYAQWYIQRDSNYASGCVIKNYKSNNKAMRPENGATTDNTSVKLNAYSNNASFKWMTEQVINVPQGVIIHDEDNPGAGAVTKYVAPGETRSLTQLRLDAAVYYGSGLNQSVTWDSDDDSVAAVNATTGAVTGVAPGTATITATRAIGNATYQDSYTIKVTKISNGTYFLKNKETGRYADIEGPTMAAGTNIHQWEFHSCGSQRWIFTHVGDGYYSIRSANASSYYYLGVEDDGTATDTQVVLRTGSLTDGMKWRILTTTSGAYKIVPKTGEPNDRVLAVAWYVLDGNGIKIKQCDYSDNMDFKDEWLLSKPESPVYGIFSGHRISSRSFTIQCTGVLSTGTEWYPLIQASVTAWNNSEAETNISVGTDHSQYTCEVDSYDDDWFGLTSSYNPYVYIYSANIQINARTCSTDDNSRKSTITHEIGHLLGLDDDPPVLNGNDSLMCHGRNRTTIYEPQAYDIMNVNYIYSLH